MGALARVDNGNPFCDNTYYIPDKRMKNKNRPKREQHKTKPKKAEKRFNSWICKYFDLNGKGIIDKTNHKS